jgi:hypothetical protein
MEEKVLSIKQMLKLIKLGVDTSKATIYWAKQVNGSQINDKIQGKPFLSLHKSQMICGFTRFEITPALTLQDIIELLPKKINDYELNIYVTQGLIQYDKPSCCDDLDILHEVYGNSLIENAYTMLCFLAKYKNHFEKVV